MPFRRRPGVRKMRKPARRFKRKGLRRTTVNVNRALQPFAQRYITKMKYVESVQLNVGNSYAYAFNLNSIFDPNRTGVGGTPYGYTTMATLYNRYRVIGCSYTIQGINTTNTIVLTANPANELITFTNIDDAMENPRTKWVLQTQGGGMKVLKGNVYIPSVVGRSKTQYMSDDRFSAQIGASPAELCVLNIAAQSINSGDVNVDIVVTLNYLVECFDQKNL